MPSSTATAAHLDDGDDDDATVRPDPPLGPPRPEGARDRRPGPGPADPHAGGRRHHRVLLRRYGAGALGPGRPGVRRLRPGPPAAVRRGAAAVADRLGGPRWPRRRRPARVVGLAARRPA